MRSVEAVILGILIGHIISIPILWFIIGRSKDAFYQCPPNEYGRFRVVSLNPWRLERAALDGEGNDG